MSHQQVTRWVCVGVVIALVIYDCFVGFNRTSGDTISEVVRDFCSTHPAVIFAAGFLCGHLLWWQVAQRQ